MLTLSLIICLIDLIVWMACIRFKNPPAGFAEIGKIIFAVGLVAYLFGR